MNVLDSFSLKGKTVVVTGGAGLYGRQIVEAVAEAGARTVMASRNVAKLEEVAAALRDRGFDASAVAMDQGDESSVRAARDQVLERCGSLHGLVNNAVARTMKSFDDDADRFQESMRVNATGLFTVTRAFGEVMAAGGSIVNIGSIMGLIGLEPLNYRGTSMSGWAPDYFFHKGGMVNFTRFCASYYGPKGTRCNCVHPGGFQTPDHPEAFVRNYSERTCLGRMANATDLKGVVVFLLADASRYITGANIPVDGGYTAK
jgi:NAD(P)-dependent dehydrogenase (short-subunit alcohol dehydrogenase family)